MIERFSVYLGIGNQVSIESGVFKRRESINEEIEDNRILREREQQKQDSIRYQLELKKKESAKKKADEQFENV